MITQLKFHALNSINYIELIRLIHGNPKPRVSTNHCTLTQAHLDIPARGITCLYIALVKEHSINELLIQGTYFQ